MVQHDGPVQRPHLPAAARRWGRFFGARACGECGVVLDPGRHETFGCGGRRISDRAARLEDGHIRPRAARGEHAGLNLRPLCDACNRARGARETERSRRWLALKERRAEAAWR